MTDKCQECRYQTPGQSLEGTPYEGLCYDCAKEDHAHHD